MSDPKEKQKDNEQTTEDVDFHGATVVDESGKETPITEEMVRKAIHELEPEAYPEIEDENNSE